MPILETSVSSKTGPYLYSDWSWHDTDMMGDTCLNTFCQIPFIGSLGGICRIVLAIIHTINHLFMAMVTLEKGHLFHAAKGVCELLHGCIETIPIIGQIFDCCFSCDQRNPTAPYSSGYFILSISDPEHPSWIFKLENGTDEKGTLSSFPDYFHNPHTGQNEKL